MSAQNTPLAIFDGFLDALVQLPDAPRPAVSRFAHRLRASPSAPEFSGHQVDGADPGMELVQVTATAYAVLYRPAQGVHVLLYVADEAAASAWARGHRVSVHPSTGSLQVYARMDSAAAPEPSLEALGVPTELSGEVAAALERDELEPLAAKLPAEALEALVCRVEGEPVEELRAALDLPEPASPIDTKDFAAALRRDGSRRSFAVLTNDAALEAMLGAPLEKWRVFLHPSQRRLVNRKYNGPVRVLGGAGTGKTVVAMHRAVWLAENVFKGSTDRILFTTFTKNLAADVAANLRKLCDPQTARRIEVVHVDRWVRDLLVRSGYDYEIVHFGDDERAQAAWDRACQLADPDSGLSPEFYRGEWEGVIQRHGCHTWEAYRVAPRRGRGARVSRRQRKGAWRVFAEYRNALERLRLREGPDAVRDARALLETGRAHVVYKSILVDEAQDMTTAVFALLRQVIPEERPNDMFIVGDGHQRIYNRRVVLSHAGVNIRGRRGKRLRINYRTTDGIRRYAVAALRGLTVDDLDDGQDTTKGYRSLRAGPPPVVEHFGSFDEEVDAIAAWVSQGGDLTQTCLVARTRALRDRYANALDGRDIDTYPIVHGRAESRHAQGLRIATMHRVKGLEFDRVVLAGMREPNFPHPDSDEALERALLYVALTRARRAVLITSHGTASAWLPGQADVTPIPAGALAELPVQATQAPPPVGRAGLRTTSRSGSVRTSAEQEMSAPSQAAGTTKPQTVERGRGGSGALGRALQAAVASVREEAGDPTGLVVVLTPSDASNVLARHRLAETGPFLRVTFLTPDQLVRNLALPGLILDGLAGEHPGWLDTTLAGLLPELVEQGRFGRHGQTLLRPGWVRPLASAVATLEQGGVTGSMLRGLDVEGDQVEILATLLDTVEGARDSEGVASPSDVALAAELALSGELVGAVQPPLLQTCGAVILGDRALAPSVFGAVRSFVNGRPRRVVRVPPFHNLPPARNGLGAAARGVEPQSCEPVTPLAGRLFGEGDASGLAGVEVLATADEVGEIREVVRAVRRAIQRGIPLDRIAIAVPDAAQIEALQAEVIRAGIPASWLVGPPLSQTGAAQFLRLVLAVADGDDTVPAWYDLLRHPGLLLRQELGPAATRGKTRWRRILADCGANQGTQAILAAVSAWADGLDDEDAKSEGERAGAASLTMSIEALYGAMDPLPRSGTMREHGAAWRGLLRRWRRRTAGQARIDKLLAAWEASTSLRKLGLSVAAGLLHAELEATANATGGLGEPRVIVAPPLALLGGAFELVCVLGLTEKRFPKAAKEDALLTDRMLEALESQVDGAFLRLQDHPWTERRRLAAAVASCTGELVLSVPRTEQLTARPTLPGSLVLEVVSAVLGRRARFHDVRAVSRKAGGRDVFKPDDASDAVRPSEWRMAHLETQEGRRRLAAHPWARGQLQLHLSLHDLATRKTVDAWTGRLDPALLDDPLVSGAPAKPHVLAQGALEPGKYLVQRLLGAWRARRLSGAFSLLDKYVWSDLMVAVATLAADLEGPPERRFDDAWESVVGETLRYRPEVTAQERAVAKATAAEVLPNVIAGIAVPPLRPLPSTLPATAGTTVMLAEERVGADLHRIRSEGKRSFTQSWVIGPLLIARALRDAGEEVSGVQLHGVLNPRTAKFSLSKDAERVETLLADAVARAQAGLYPVLGARVGLGAEGRIKWEELEVES